MNVSTVTVSSLQATIARALAQSPAARGRIERAATLIVHGHLLSTAARFVTDSRLPQRREQMV